MLDPLKIAQAVDSSLADEQSGYEKLSKYLRARVIVRVELEVRKALRDALDKEGADALCRSRPGS